MKQKTCQKNTSYREGVQKDENSTIGRCQVTVQANGFGKETIAPFPLEILQTAKLNVPLKIGTTAETVEVSNGSTHS
jgi:hypothetical protein